MDFYQDPDAFVMSLARSGREVNRARENFLELIHHWKTLSEKRFGNTVIIDHLPESQGFIGSVMGKSFSIIISPIATGDTGVIEAMVTVPSVPHGSIEIGRFQMNHKGDLIGDVSDPGEHRDNTVSIRVFMGVLKAVLEAPLALAQ